MNKYNLLTTDSLTLTSLLLFRGHLSRACHDIFKIVNAKLRNAFITCSVMNHVQNLLFPYAGTESKTH